MNMRMKINKYQIFMNKTENYIIYLYFIFIKNSFVLSKEFFSSIAFLELETTM